MRRRWWLGLAVGLLALTAGITAHQARVGSIEPQGSSEPADDKPAPVRSANRAAPEVVAESPRPREAKHEEARPSARERDGKSESEQAQGLEDALERSTGRRAEALPPPPPADESLAVEGDPTTCSMKTELESNVDFVNDCATPVDLSWIDFNCRERVYRTLGAGERHSQSTYVTHAWRVRDSKSQRLLQQAVSMAVQSEVHACGDSTVREADEPDAGPRRECAPVVVEAAKPALCSLKQKTAASRLRFVNTCLGTTVNLLWVNFDCNEVPYRLLNPGAESFQDTYVSHTWRFRDAATGALYGEFTPRAPVNYDVATCACGTSPGRRTP